MPESKKPPIGENSSDLPTPSAWLQSTPLVAEGPCSSWFISPTPMMEPTSVCELDDGRPKYHVPVFQTMAAMSSANTMAKPASLPTCRINSTGSSCRMPNATAPVYVNTPRKLHVPDQITAGMGARECV